MGLSGISWVFLKHALGQLSMHQKEEFGLRFGIYLCNEGNILDGIGSFANDNRVVD